MTAVCMGTFKVTESSPTEPFKVCRLRVLRVCELLIRRCIILSEQYALYIAGKYFACTSCFMTNVQDSVGLPLSHSGIFDRKAAGYFRHCFVFTRWFFLLWFKLGLFWFMFSCPKPFIFGVDMSVTIVTLGTSVVKNTPSCLEADFPMLEPSSIAHEIYLGSHNWSVN